MTGRANAKFAYITVSESGPVSRVIPVHFIGADTLEERKGMLKNLFVDCGPGKFFDADVPDDLARTDVEIAYCYGDLSV